MRSVRRLRVLRVTLGALAPVEDAFHGAQAELRLRGLAWHELDLGRATPDARPARAHELRGPRRQIPEPEPAERIELVERAVRVHESRAPRVDLPALRVDEARVKTA